MANRRTSVYLDGMHHGAPIPNGAKVGNVVFSSAIFSTNPETRSVSEDPAEQARQLFANIRAFMEKVGGSPEDIGQMSITVKEDKLRENLNVEWEKMFPDENSRPARHTELGTFRGPGGFQVELTAVLAS